MRLPILSAAFAALCLALPTAAQANGQIQIFGGDGDRAATTQILFGADVMAGMSITYGQPAWSDSYDAMLEKIKGRLNRLGKDWWTTFTTSAAVEIGGVKVPAGAYVVGLDCDKDGKFSLALHEATSAMKAGATPWPIDKEGTMNWKPEILVPLTLNKGTAAESVAKMTMTLVANAKDLKQGTFTLAWGKHTLTAPLAVHTGK
jgi:hypothetical protein